MRRPRGPQPEAVTEEPGPFTATPEQLTLELEDVERVPDNPHLRRPTRVIVSNQANDLV